MRTWTCLEHLIYVFHLALRFSYTELVSGSDEPGDPCSHTFDKEPEAVCLHAGDYDSNEVLHQPSQLTKVEKIIFGHVF